METDLFKRYIVTGVSFFFMEFPDHVESEQMCVFNIACTGSEYLLMWDMK